MEGWKYAAPELTFEVSEAGPTSTISSANTVLIYLSTLWEFPFLVSHFLSEAMA
jgi:hypothetical protein